MTDFIGTFGGVALVVWGIVLMVQSWRINDQTNFAMAAISTAFAAFLIVLPRLL